MNTLFIKLMISIQLLFLPEAAVTPGLYFLSPTDGSVVQGVVEIRGSIPDGDFSYAELSYAFADNSSGNWFVISRIDKPIQNGILTFWDTTTITDGIYKLKLTVFQTNGNSGEVIVEDIRVGNYTHYDTPVPATFSTVQNAISTVVPTVVVSPEPTGFARNPASIEEEDILVSISSSLAILVLGFGGLGLYLLIRYLSRK